MRSILCVLALFLLNFLRSIGMKKTGIDSTIITPCYNSFVTPSYLYTYDFFHQRKANSQGVTPHRQGYAMYKSLRSLLSLRRGVEVCGVTVGICDVRPR